MNGFSDDDSEDYGMDYSASMKLLENIRSGKAGYVDSSDILDAYDALLSNNKDKEAVEVLRFGISQHPNDSNLLLTNATCLTNAGQFKEAESLLDYLRPVMENYPYFHVNVGWLRMQQDDMLKAIEEFEVAIQKSSSSTERYDVTYEICSNLSKMSYFEEAVHFFKKMTKSELLQDYDNTFEYAFALAKIGRNEEAQTVYEAILEKWPTAESAWYNLGIIYHDMRMEQKAIDAFNNAIAICKDYAEAYFNLGNIYNVRGEVDKAIECYSDYIAYCNGKPDAAAYAFIGECWMYKGDRTMGRRFYKQALKADPMQPVALFGLAQMEFDDDNFPKTVTMMNKAIKSDPDNFDLYVLKAEAQKAMLQTNESLATLEKGLHYSPNNLWVWLMVIITHYKLEEDKFDPMHYVEKVAPKYGDPDALKVLKAFFIFVIDRNSQEVLDILKDVAGRDPYLLSEASSYTTLHGMFEDKRIKKQVEAWGITIEEPADGPESE